MNNSGLFGYRSWLWVSKCR